jgi:3-dehydroquinate dehydratase
VEGELINELQRAGFDSDGIVLNPGGYTHTSVAIGDAIAAIKAPVVEVHIPMCMRGKTSEKSPMYPPKQPEVLSAWE